jgi:putative flippase GtrA
MKEERTSLMTKMAHSPESEHFPRLKSVAAMERRFGTFRVVRFAIASALGFLVFEAVVAFGVVMLYGSINVPSFATSSSWILGLDVVALGIGATVAFLINEQVTVQDSGVARKKGRLSWSLRWGEYQLASLLGNVIIIVVQVSLLATIALSPVFGNVVGAIVSYPVTYVVAMHLVWRVRPFGSR